MKKPKDAVPPVHAVGDEIWFAWVGYGSPMTVHTMAIKVKAVGPLQTTLEDYPPYSANEGSHARSRLRGKNFETGVRHPSTQQEAVDLLREALAREKQGLDEMQAYLAQKIAAVGEP